MRLFGFIKRAKGIDLNHNIRILKILRVMDFKNELRTKSIIDVPIFFLKYRFQNHFNFASHRRHFIPVDPVVIFRMFKRDTVVGDDATIAACRLLTLNSQ